MLNFWYLLAPIYAVIAFMFGTMKYRVSKRDRIMIVSRGDGMLNVVSGILSLSLHFSVVAESFRGMIQLIVDHVPEPELGWLPILLAGGIISSTLVMFVVYYYCGKLGEVVICHLLRYLLERKRRLEELRQKTDLLPEKVH